MLVSRLHPRSRAIAVAVASLALFLPPLDARAETGFVDFDRYPDGRAMASGTFLTTQYEAAGVVFPSGVYAFRCADSAGCDLARSGENAARTSEDEFEGRAAFRARFTSLQEAVHLFVRSDKEYASPQELSATLQVFDSGGNEIGDTTATFLSSSGWESISLLFFERRISSIVLNVRRAGDAPTLPSAPFAIDDLSFRGDPPPLPPNDDERPTAEIIEPPHLQRITVPSFRLVVEVNDNRDISSTHAVVSDPTAARTEYEVCGSGAAPPCPAPNSLPARLTRTIVLPEGSPNGRYFLTVITEDLSGNRGSDTHSFILEVVAPVPVFADRIEVNQGVQPDLYRVPPPGQFLNVPPEQAGRFPFLTGKDTLLRFYLFGDGGYREDFSARLEVSVGRRDGTRMFRRIDPNVAPGNSSIPGATVDVEQDPGSEEELRALRADMRKDLTRTLNFVIPRSFLPLDAEYLELRLVGVTGLMQGFFDDPVAMGLNIVRVWSDRGVAPARSVTQPRVVSYLRRTFPVSDVPIVSDRTLDADGYSSDVCDILDEVWSVFGGDDAPVQRFSFPGRTVVPTLGLVPGGAAGCAKLGDPEDDRVGGTAVSTAHGDFAAHELGHTLGLIHASTAHGETRDGEDEAEAGWPHTHGTIGDANFGSIIWATVQSSPPSATTLGTWNARIVDPCPATVQLLYHPECALAPNDGARVHDFMSYGSNNGDLTPLVTQANNWASNVTYRRIYRAIRFGEEPSFARPTSSAGGSNASAGRVDALLLLGKVNTDGTVELEPFQRKLVPLEMAQDEPGPFTAEIRDGRGVVLMSRTVGLTQLTRGGEGERIMAAIPVVPGAHSLVLLRDGERVAEVKATRKAPTVRLISPGDGEVLADGEHAIRWQAEDGDGDPVWSLLQYSPDGGETWQGIELIRPGEPTQVNLLTDELVAGSDALLRLTVSDGFLTGVAESACPFSVGTDAAPAACVEVKPGEGEPTVNTRANGVIPVSILTTDSLNAADVDASSVCFGDANAAEERDCGEEHGTGHLEDVDGDLDLDLVLHFQTMETGIDPGDSSACLSAETIRGALVTGCDAIRAT